MKNVLLRFTILISLFFSLSAFANDGFPGRAEFPEIPLYQKADLIRDFDKVMIVDTRSALEYETLRIKGAVNIPISIDGFGKKVRELRKITKKPIIFYCNGRTCYKSYRATKAALRRGVKKVYAYDAGVFEWAKEFPSHAVLLGTNPMDPSKIIPKADLQARFLSPKQFTETARAAPKDKKLILDVRDLHQRGGVGYFTGMERWVSLNDQKKLEEFLKKAQAENRTLYIYDEAGKQVRWLQYMLERYNIKDYFFMAKGVKGFYKDMIL